MFAGGMQSRPQDVSNTLSEDMKANANLPSHGFHEVTNEVDALQASEENSKENDAQQEHDHKSEQDVNRLPLERLSLGHLDHKSMDSISVANQEGETPVEICLSNGSMVKKEPPQETSISNGSLPEGGQSNDGDHLESSPRSARASDSAGIHTEVARCSPLANPQNKKAEPLLRMTTPDSGGSWHHSSNADRVQRENKLGFRRHSHKRQHERRQVSPQRQYSRSETVIQVPITQGYPSQSMSSQSPQVQQGGQTQSQYSISAAHPNLTTAHAWSMPNAQQQNFPPSQTQLFPQPAYPQPQITQYPVQSNEQLGQMQNNQAYNQMWQYYLYQQQQQQQFLLQQPQHQQPQVQQQLTQQQYQQHRQMLQVQQQYLQQQQLPYQQPQLQQQQQFIQHQEQQYLQLQHQQQQQGSYQQQLPPQHHHLYLQHQPQQHQEQEQRQQEQIIASQVSDTKFFQLLKLVDMFKSVSWGWTSH